MNSLSGKIALVTGASQGIGKRIAEVLSANGAKVLVTARSENLIRDVASKIKQNGNDARWHPLDVRKEDQWIASIEYVVKEYGGLDILVNNAGLSVRGLIEELTLEKWRSAMEINAEGVFLGLKHGILTMKPGGVAGKGGSIINISSMVSWVGVPGTAAYSSSKGAVRMLTKVAAVECGKLNYGIRVNSVNPGVIRTQLTVEGFKTIAEEESSGFATPEAAEAAFTALHPIGKLGTTDDIAQAVLYFASDASGFVTGSELLVDGGYTAQ